MTASAHWAWHNLQNGLAVGEAAKLEAAFFQGSAPIELYRDVFYCTAGIILLFGLLAVVFRKFDVGSYRTLPDAARLIFVSHNAFFLVFLLTAIPYSVTMVRVLFAPSSPKNLLEKPVYRCISFSLAFQVVMYALEIILLIGLFVLNFGDSSHTSKDSALYWVGMVMTIALVVLQLYTFVIYRAIWRSTTGKQQMTRLKSHNLDASPDVLKSMELPANIVKAIQLNTQQPEV
ncbi:hypothetical protein WJX79_000604 [Trebouxia sp. C0005]